MGLGEDSKSPSSDSKSVRKRDRFLGVFRSRKSTNESQNGPHVTQSQQSSQVLPINVKTIVELLILARTLWDLRAFIH